MSKIIRSSGKYRSWLGIEVKIEFLVEEEEEREVTQHGLEEVWRGEIDGG